MPGILENRIAERTAKNPKESGGAAPAEKERIGIEEFRKSRSGRSDGEVGRRRASDEEGSAAERRRPEDGRDGRRQKAVGSFMKGRREEEDETPKRLDETPLSEEDVRELEELEAMMSGEAYARGEKRRKNVRRAGIIVMTLLCVYLTMLIYGTLVTEFRYDETGAVAPVEMSVQDISNRNEYMTIIGMYMQCRALYEKVLVLDYRMASGVEDLMAIAPEYEESIDVVNSLAVQLEAVQVGSKYNQVLYMMLTWVNTHMFNYCRYMSTAVSQGDEQAAAEAIAARQHVYDDFQLLTQNVVTLGGDVKGYSLTEITDWSPEGFVQKHLEGIG